MSIIMRRNLMGGKPLPYLRKLKYLTGTGSQYIDTGIVPSVDDVISCTFQTRSGDSRPVYGVFETTEKAVSAFVRSSSTATWRFFRGSRSIAVGSGIKNSVMSKNGVIINGSEYLFGEVGGNATKSIFVFGCNLNNNAKFIGDIYSFEVSGVNRMSLIPVMSLENKPCMYDEVSGKTFKNLGTGDDFDYAELDAASGAFSTEGGGTKCLTPRCSYRRSLRHSARFCALASRRSQKWEVAA